MKLDLLPSILFSSLDFFIQQHLIYYICVWKNLSLSRCQIFSAKKNNLVGIEIIV